MWITNSKVRIHNLEPLFEWMFEFSNAFLFNFIVYLENIRYRIEYWGPFKDQSFIPKSDIFSTCYYKKNCVFQLRIHKKSCISTQHLCNFLIFLCHFGLVFFHEKFCTFFYKNIVNNKVILHFNSKCFLKITFRCIIITRENVFWYL